MSSLMIIQEYDRLIFASDTARCEGDRNGIYRCYGEKVKKVHSAGKDMVFVSGMTECTEAVERNLNKFVNKNQHVNIELLRQYLNRKFPKIKCRWTELGLHDIGVTILAVINGRSVVCNFSQSNEYNPMISNGESGTVKLWVAGFNNSLINKNALEYIQSLTGQKYKNPDTFVKVYQRSYSEAVGGYVQVYEMDSNKCNLIQESKLHERNLKYVFKSLDSVPVELLQNIPVSARRQYSAHITSAKMTGGTIEGTVITSETDNSSTVIDGGAFTSTGSQATGANTTKIEEGTISTSYININQRGDTNRVGITPGNVLVKNASGQTNISPELITTNQINCGSIYVGVSSLAPSLEGHMHSILHSGGIAKVTAYENNFRPHSISGDNAISCGSPSYRWTQVYAATATISTSDRQLKEQETFITEKEKKVALKVKQLLKNFKYKDAVSKKGANARIHTGVIAQDVKEAFESEGLNAYDYALFCSDTWYEKDGKACDDEEISYTASDEGVTEVTRLGIRYEELLCFIVAAL